MFPAGISSKASSSRPMNTKTSFTDTEATCSMSAADVQSTDFCNNQSQVFSFFLILLATQRTRGSAIMRCCLARIFISVSDCKVSRTSIIRAFSALGKSKTASHYGNRIPITVAEFSVSLSSEHLSVFLLTDTHVFSFTQCMCIYLSICCLII